MNSPFSATICWERVSNVNYCSAFIRNSSASFRYFNACIIDRSKHARAHGQSYRQVPIGQSGRLSGQRAWVANVEYWHTASRTRSFHPLNPLWPACPSNIKARLIFFPQKMKGVTSGAVTQRCLRHSSICPHTVKSKPNISSCVNSNIFSEWKFTHTQCCSVCTKPGQKPFVIAKLATSMAQKF